MYPRYSTISDGNDLQSIVVTISFIWSAVIFITSIFNRAIACNYFILRHLIPAPYTPRHGSYFRAPQSYPIALSCLCPQFQMNHTDHWFLPVTPEAPPDFYFPLFQYDSAYYDFFKL